MFDRGLHLTLLAIRRQLAAMPHDLYLIRLIHGQTHRAFPGERLWTAAQLIHPATVRFLRVRNREGCDIYIQPYAPDRNPGYILVDLDQASPSVVETMRANGHAPCVVLQTSPGNLQAWVRVSVTPLEPAVASAIGKQLARTYGGDSASTDWRHLGRLAGFTNQKPQRRSPGGYPPWVKVWQAHGGLATQGAALLRSAALVPTCWQTVEHGWCQAHGPSVPRMPHTLASDPANTGLSPPADAADIYRGWLHRLRIPERFPQPDWSIADKWIAKELLRQDTPVAQVAAILRHGSPAFPRQHANPEDYLCRTLTRAAWELQGLPFPGRDSFPRRPAHHTTAPAPPHR